MNKSSRSAVSAKNKSECPDQDQLYNTVYVGWGNTSAPTSTLSDLMKEDIPPMRWAAKGLLPEGICLLVGAPKIGKSWFALQLGLAITSGKPIWEGRQPEKKGHVLYLALEDGKRRLKKRAQLLGKYWPSSPRFHYRLAWPSLDAGGVEELDAWLQYHPKTRLVIIDTLARVRAKTNSSSSAYTQDYGVGIALKPIIDKHPVCILLVHHTRKEPAREDVLDSISGTNGLVGGADTALILSRKRGAAEAGLSVIGRDIEVEPQLAMKFDLDDGAWKPTGEVGPRKKPVSPERQRILSFLRANGQCGPKKLAKGIGVESGNVRVLLMKMLESGQVARSPGGLYTHTP